MKKMQDEILTQVIKKDGKTMSSSHLLFAKTYFHCQNKGIAYVNQLQ